MELPELRRRVVDLLHAFTDPRIREAWLRCQAMMWDREPSEVFSLLAHTERTPPPGRFTFTSAPDAGEDPWVVLDANLLTGRPVWLTPRGYRPTGYADPVSRAEVLCGLLEQLHEPVPPLGDTGGGLAEWSEHANRALIDAATKALTPSAHVAATAAAIVTQVLGHHTDAHLIPVRRNINDPIDGWHDLLDTLTTAQSAAATILITLGVEAGADGPAPRTRRDLPGDQRGETEERKEHA